MPGVPRPARSLIAFVAAQVALALILLAVWSHFEIDDAYIFLTYARHLAVSSQFAFNPGEISYGFSSPAWVMLLALVSRLTTLPVSVALSNSVGIILCALASTLAWSLWGQLDQRPQPGELPLAAVLLSGPWFFTVWFIFGMETGLAIVCIFGFLLWLARLRSNAPRLPTFFLGVASVSILSVTRLESCIFIACGVILCTLRTRSRKVRLQLALVAAIAGLVEGSWMLFARRTFGASMPWSSQARLLYYLPLRFTHISGDAFDSLTFLARTRLAIAAAAHIAFGGPLRILLIPCMAFAAVFVARAQPRGSRLRFLLIVALTGCIAKIIAFAYLFPLAQNRHAIPYVAALYVLMVPTFARHLCRVSRPLQAAAWLLLIAVWIVGAIQFRREGLTLQPLHQLAASGLLTASDRVAAEPIGILAFETSAHILDLGGLTDRTVWPILAAPPPPAYMPWITRNHATKAVLPRAECPSTVPVFGNYCLLNLNPPSSPPPLLRAR